MAASGLLVEEDVLVEDTHKGIGELLADAAQTSQEGEDLFAQSKEFTDSALDAIFEDWAQKPYGAATRLQKEVAKAIATRTGLAAHVVLDGKVCTLPDKPKGQHAAVWIQLSRVHQLKDHDKVNLGDLFTDLVWLMNRKGKTDEVVKLIDESVNAPSAVAEVTALRKSIEVDEDKDEDGKSKSKTLANLIPGTAAVDKFTAIVKGEKPAGDYGVLDATVAAACSTKIAALKAALDAAAEALVEGLVVETAVKALDEAMAVVEVSEDAEPF